MHAEDIIKNLRYQFSYLFYESLKVRSLLNKNNLSINLRSLTGEALEVLLTKPQEWGFRLFSAVLNSGLDDLQNRKRDYTYNISHNSVVCLKSMDEVSDYVERKTSHLQNLITNLSTVFKSVLAEVFANPDRLDNADLLVYAAQAIKDVYSSIIDWSLSFNEVSSNEHLRRITESLSRVCDPTLEDIERFAEKCSRHAQRLKENPQYDPDDSPANISLELRLPDAESFYATMRYLHENIGLLIQ